MSPITIFFGLLGTVGAISCVKSLAHIASLVWLYTKPSTLKRYLHDTDGKPAWALVTGASGGIGSQFSHQLASLGFNVVLHGRNLDKLQQIQSELSQAHPARSFRILVIDAAQAFEATGAASDDWAAQLGDINLTVLINNAGGSTERMVNTLDKLSASRLVTDTSVNAMFPTLLLRQTIPLLQRNSPSLVINIGSLADIGPSCTGTYAASRSYLNKLTETVAREMRLTNHDVEVIGVRLGNVYGTGQSTAPAPGFAVPDAPTAAKAVLSRVGCGEHVVVGYWPHALQFESTKLLPKFVLERLLVNLVSGRNPDLQIKKNV
jgi:17beta-estradiol 17-dehydrogenase / very-long-chain 3-oxoacyl-CoA reductase